jgi:hypothetical protein
MCSVNFWRTQNSTYFLKIYKSQMNSFKMKCKKVLIYFPTAIASNLNETFHLPCMSSTEIDFTTTSCSILIPRGCKHQLYWIITRKVLSVDNVRKARTESGSIRKVVLSKAGVNKLALISCSCSTGNRAETSLLKSDYMYVFLVLSSAESNYFYWESLGKKRKNMNRQEVKEELCAICHFLCPISPTATSYQVAPTASFNPIWDNGNRQ